MTKNIGYVASETLVAEALQYYKRNNSERSVELCEQVLRIDPRNHGALHLYGCICDDLGQLDRAIELVSNAVKNCPKAHPYHYNLANMLVKRGHLREAISHYQEAVRLKPDYAVAHNNLGMALGKLGKSEDAVTSFQLAIRLSPAYADPHFNLGLEHRAQGRLDAAIGEYRQAIRLKPGHAQAYFNLGNALSQGQQLSEAVAAFREALRLQPEAPKVNTNLGNALLKLGLLAEATTAFKEALRIDPNDVFAHSNLILAASYLSDDPATTLEECRRWAIANESNLLNGRRQHQNSKNESTRIRVGYVSGDYRSHAAAYWIEPLLANHDKSAIEIYCYSISAHGDEVTERLMAYADKWVNCFKMSDEELEAKIACDGIDILVDLSGHTDGNRLRVFARQPAPIQFSWFGLPVSTGLRSIQYRFTDDRLDPIGEGDQYYSETLVRLHRFYAAFRPDTQTPPVQACPLHRKGFVTFASLNNLAKITPALLDVWASILQKMPHSRLLFQAAGLDDTDVAKRVMKHFTQRAVAADRITLRGWSTTQQFFNIGSEVDIALDPFPFNGGVTTCHALWMGLPVVTMAGQTQQAGWVRIS
jgi:protein O-GlcNAc transferase